jgi:hypothetical protein
MKTVIIKGTGSDPLQLARGLASQVGRYLEITGAELMDPAKLLKAMLQHPKVLVVTDFYFKDNSMPWLKTLTSDQTWQLRDKLGRITTTEPARLIILCNSPDFVTDRRFHVMRADHGRLVEA